MALKVNDLRVNNWYKFIKTSDNSNEVVYEQIRDGCMIDVAIIIGEPIQLTPEILKKCGFSFEFTTDDSPKFLPIDELFITHSNDNFPLLNNKEDAIYASSYGDNEGIGIKYLHQLQNRFFSLTGKELIYNPK
jgi:hypothetical protein